MMQMKIGRKQLAAIAAVVAVIVAIYLIGTYVTGWFVVTDNADGNASYDALAKCLTQKGAVMYGSKYCPHCTEQKQMFGDSFQYVTYVECTELMSLCQAKGVQAVPAWEIDGKISVGVKTLEQLATAAGCTL